jgi:hypothetical protein
MKIYFLASPRVIAEKKNFFLKVYGLLAREGKLVDDLVYRLAKDKLKDFYKADRKERINRFRKWMKNVTKCDVLVVEASGHSMTLGYVIGKALELNKPVVALHQKGEESYFVSGIASSKLQMMEYEGDLREDQLKKVLERAKKMVDVRFNFFVSPEILTYLDWVSTSKKVPRSVFLRELIEKQMKKDREFKG